MNISGRNEFDGCCGRILFEVQDIWADQGRSTDQNEKRAHAYGWLLFTNWLHWKNFQNRKLTSLIRTDAV
jgi:hypothetical protein